MCRDGKKKSEAKSFLKWVNQLWMLLNNLAKFRIRRPIMVMLFLVIMSKRKMFVQRTMVTPLGEGVEQDMEVEDILSVPTDNNVLKDSQEVIIVPNTPNDWDILEATMVAQGDSLVEAPFLIL
ncbi:unnamed protein product [Ilex paraguariensis]|uniref:Uncharacterized protein n=1 Tax=Ilex paraguariensis TaxID=185542 RepID=A0ABC8RMW0_9AQUA